MWFENTYCNKPFGSYSSFIISSTIYLRQNILAVQYRCVYLKYQVKKLLLKRCANVQNCNGPDGQNICPSFYDKLILTELTYLSNKSTEIHSIERNERTTRLSGRATVTKGSSLPLFLPFALCALNILSNFFVVRLI